MDEITITLPLPPKELSPNARVHWARKAKATRGARLRAYAETCDRMIHLVRGEVRRRRPEWERAQTEAAFYLPDRRQRDADNLAASLKSYWDGIATAGIVQNDAGFTHSPPRLLVDRENPRVELTIRPLP